MKLNGLSHHGRQGQSAFSIIELMVATVVMLVVFVTIFATMTMGLSITQLSRENLRATQIMLDKMEGVRLYNWDQLTNSSVLAGSFVNWFFETNNIGSASATGNGVMYSGTISVAAPTNMSPVYSNSMREVIVTVNWLTGATVHKRSMSTYVSQMGMQNYVFSN
ncbi:MAG: hypothetical protein JWQ71_1936 [Pedosphaera sp.]|nr:hypothetical protein [Pedosphaera sp.]